MSTYEWSGQTESAEGEVSRDEQKVRARVRARFTLARHAVEFAVLVPIFFLLDWATGGEGSGINWAGWVAGFWGACLAIEFLLVYAAPPLHGWRKGVEEGMVQRELRRREIS